MKNIKKSLAQNWRGIIIMITASFFTASGQLFWKIFQENNNNYFLISGFLFYGIGAILMISAFRFGKYSIIHPIMCTSYVFAVLFGNFFLNEGISTIQYLGIALIILGVIFIGGGDE
jgi:uncharacterized membrane protein